MFEEATQDLKHMMQDLKRLLTDLESIQRRSRSDSLNNLVRFFKYLSPWEDERRVSDLIHKMKKIGAMSLVVNGHTITLETLESLDRCISHGGRNKYGMNKSDRFEDIDDGNIFIGGSRGIHMDAVRRWKMMESHLPSDYRTACNMAHEYVETHLQVTIDVIQHIVRNPTNSKDGILSKDSSPLALMR